VGKNLILLGDNMIYLLKVWINNSCPQIWREIEVDKNTFLPDFHKILQTVMGWTNSHLHQFSKGKIYYSNTDYEEYDRDDTVDYKNIKISDLMKKKNDTILYEYDFGDGWEHSIKLLELKDKQKDVFYPRCVLGERSCPAEDSGGIYGYQEMLKVLKNKSHPEYEDFREWIGEDFDPDYFNIDEVNELLKEDNFGCIEIFD
jgi:hypothetical protein